MSHLLEHEHINKFWKVIKVRRLQIIKFKKYTGDSLHILKNICEDFQTIITLERKFDIKNWFEWL